MAEDAERHVREAEAVEGRARKEEKIATKELETLKQNEGELRSDIDELHSIIIAKAMEEWKNQRERKNP